MSKNVESLKELRGKLIETQESRKYKDALDEAIRMLSAMEYSLRLELNAGGYYGFEATKKNFHEKIEDIFNTPKLIGVNLVLNWQLDEVPTIDVNYKTHVW